MAIDFPSSPTVNETFGVTGGPSWKWNGTTWDMITQSSDNGADVLVYGPAGTGAVDTTVKAKLDQIVSVKDFGASGDGVTDDAAAIQLAIDYVKTLYDSTLGDYTAKLDFAGQNYRVESPIDATEIRQPGFTMQNGGLYGVMSGGIVLDLSGTNSMILKDFRVYGDETTTPDVGILQARALISGSYAAAGSHKFFNVQCNGFYNKAALCNFASEVSSYYGCRFTNRSRTLTAYAVIHTGNMDAITNYAGGAITSTFSTIPSAGTNYSNILHYHAQAHIQRPADVNLTITSITAANPAVVTVDSDDLTAAGLTNGDSMWVYSLVGSGSEWESLNYQVYTVASLNEGAGTFALTGANASGFTDTFTSGKVQNQTGPAILHGGGDAIKIGDGSYVLTYGSPVITMDTEPGSGFRDCEFSFQAEHSPPTIIDFRRDTASTYIVQQLTLELLNASQVNVDDVIRLTDGSPGGGTIRFNGLDLRIAVMGTAPTNGLFSDATNFDLRNAKIYTPLAASMNTIADFVNFTGEVFSTDGTAVRTVHGLDVLRMRENAVANTTVGSIRFNNNSWYWYNDTDSAERRFQVQNTGTTAHFADISDPLNTEDKYAGKMAYNISLNKPVWADAGGAGDIWVDATGSTVHTPV